MPEGLVRRSLGGSGEGVAQRPISLSCQDCRQQQLRRSEACGWDPLPLAFLGELLNCVMSGK